MQVARYDYTEEDTAADALLAGHYASDAFLLPSSVVAPKLVPIPPALDIIPGAWAACSITSLSKLPPILLLMHARVTAVYAILPLAMLAVTFRTRVVHIFSPGQKIVVVRTHAGAYGVPSLRFFRQHYTNPVVHDVDNFLCCEWCATDPSTMPCTECGRQVCARCTYVGREGPGYTHVCPLCGDAPDAECSASDSILSVIGM